MSKNIRHKRKQFPIYGWKVDKLLKLRSQQEDPRRIFYTDKVRIYEIAIHKETYRFLIKNISSNKKHIRLPNWSYSSSINELMPINRKDLKNVDEWISKRKFDELE